MRKLRVFFAVLAINAWVHYTRLKYLVPSLYDLYANISEQMRDSQDIVHFLAKLWWKTPPESPDLNLIENIRQKLKELIWHEIKPKVKFKVLQHSGSPLMCPSATNASTISARLYQK